MQYNKMRIRLNRNGVTLAPGAWPGLRITGARPTITLNGRRLCLRLQPGHGLHADGSRMLRWRGVRPSVELDLCLSHQGPNRCLVSGSLRNTGRKPHRLDAVDLLRVVRPDGAFALGRSSGNIRILEQSQTGGQVRSVSQILSGADGRAALNGMIRSFYSRDVTLLYHPEHDSAMLIGFETFSRFAGHIHAAARDACRKVVEKDNVDKATAGQPQFYAPAPRPDAMDGFESFNVSLITGGIRLDPGETVELETLTIETGRDPYKLLHAYADRVARWSGVENLPRPFASWCSWYPYRLGVTEKDILANARVARARHLDKLGLRYFLVDLGWEKKNVPTFFEENERFSHGLQWVASGLEDMGFLLGAWKGFAAVAESHFIFRKHPEWLVKDEHGKPKSFGAWFWEPHDTIYALDVTHPGAHSWVRRNVESLARRGVRYLKWDFAVYASRSGERHDPKVACSEACEGIRAISRTVAEAMQTGDKDALVLDITGAEFTNSGRFKLSYTNMDTGNNGLGFEHLRKVYTQAACHVFKQGRTALLQPSCVVMNGPGTLEEARLRATLTYMMAGQVDIGDDLTALPEDRWRVLKSMLPQSDTPGTPVDLFHPVNIAAAEYENLCQGKSKAVAGGSDPQGVTVWHRTVTAPWDEWQIVAVLNYFTAGANAAPTATMFDIPSRALGLSRRNRYWGYEFWSGVFLDQVPRPEKPVGAYRHPGDYASPLLDAPRGILRVVCTGPCVKLFVLRRTRPHPWPLGTTFHQSGGLDLEDVCWDEKTGTLSGCLHRSPGEIGHVCIALGAKRKVLRARVDGRSVPLPETHSRAVLIPVATRRWCTRWSLVIER